MIRNEGLPELVNKVKGVYDYYAGKSSNKLSNLKPATASEVRSSSIASEICKAFNKVNAKDAYDVQVDRGNSKLLLTFNSHTVPANLVDKFDGNDSEFGQYITDYQPSSGKVELVLDMEGDTSEKDYQPDIHTQGSTKSVIGSSVMVPVPTPYKCTPVDKEGKAVTEEDEDDLLLLELSTPTKGNSFKDHHVCSGCNKPLSQCTCKVASEEEVEESIATQTSSVGQHKSDSLDLVLDLKDTEGSKQ